MSLESNRLKEAEDQYPGKEFRGSITTGLIQDWALLIVDDLQEIQSYP